MAVSGVYEEVLELKLDRINYDGLLRIPVLGDGSCWFHCILRAICRDYIEAKSTTVRSELAVQMRHAIADFLGEYNPETKQIRYRDLAGGHLSRSAVEMPQYSIQNMQAELRSKSPVSHVYREVMSNAFNLDIYVVDLHRGDIYKTADELDLIIKKRNSVVVGYSRGHYDLIGIQRPDGIIDALFTPDHPLIETIRDRTGG